MAIITCPECGQNPVSDRAPTCPKCGCPIAAANAVIDPVASATDPTAQARTVYEERKALVWSFGALLPDSETEFPGASVTTVDDETNLAQLLSQIKGWCESITFDLCIKDYHVDLIGQLSVLKTLCFRGDTDLSDSGLLRISKMQGLCRLEFRFPNKGYTKAVGWLQLARLSRLEYLRLPAWTGPNENDREYDQMKEIKRELQSRLPNTIIK